MRNNPPNGYAAFLQGKPPASGTLLPDVGVLQAEEPLPRRRSVYSRETLHIRRSDCSHQRHLLDSIAASGLDAPARTRGLRDDDGINHAAFGIKSLRWGRLVFPAVAAVLLCSSSGCASLPAGSVRDPRDHFERFNRAMFKFDTAVDHAVFRHVARGYVKVTPAPVRTGISNFLSNLGYTSTIGNDILQGRIRDFSRDTARLVVNSTVGIGGLFDPATALGLLKHHRDFGQTLGKWGVPIGSYLVLPLLGPSDARDAVGSLPDRLMTVDGEIDETALNASLFSLRAVDARAAALPSDSMIESAYDPYAFVRSAWLQMRHYEVHGDEKNYIPDLPPLDPDPHK